MKGVVDREIEAKNKEYNADTEKTLRDLNRMNDKIENTMRDWESNALNGAAMYILFIYI